MRLICFNRTHTQDAANGLTRADASSSRTCRLVRRCVRVLLQRLKVRGSGQTCRLVKLIKVNDAAEALGAVLNDPRAGAVPAAEAHLPRNECAVNEFTKKNCCFLSFYRFIYIFGSTSMSALVSTPKTLTM